MILSQSGDADFFRQRHSLKRLPAEWDGRETRSISLLSRGRDVDSCTAAVSDILLEDSPLIKGEKGDVAVNFFSVLILADRVLSFVFLSISKFKETAHEQPVSAVPASVSFPATFG